MSDEKKYPQGSYAPGNYYNHCSTCGRQFQGDKRALQCESCGTKSQAEWDALTDEQKIERQKRSVEIYNEFINSEEYRNKINKNNSNE